MRPRRKWLKRAQRGVRSFMDEDEERLVFVVFFSTTFILLTETLKEVQTVIVRLNFN